MDKFNFIEIPNVAQPTADVVNNFINKIASALGWIVTPKNLKPSIIEANKSIIEEIVHREDINPIERAAIVNNYKKIVKEYESQVDIVQLAIKELDLKSEPQNVSQDWIRYFFDSVKNVTDDGMRAIWSRILAGEFNKPNTYSKQLIHKLSIMDESIARSFQMVRSSCFYVPPCLYTFIYRTGNIIKNSNKYNELGITLSRLKELDNIGLIQYRYPEFYSIKNNRKRIYYGNKIITLHTDQKLIKVGNVSLTSVGKQLCRIVPIEYDNRVLEICINSWQQLGYQPFVEKIEE